MKKRGQFYLVATVIIVIILVGLATIANYAMKKSEPNLEKIRDELKTEGEKVLDYDLVYGTNYFDDFAKDYSEYIGDETDLYFIVGESGNINASKYSGGTASDLTSDITVDSGNETIEFTLDDLTYDFDLKSGQNFYFIIVKEERGEKYILSN